MSIWVSLICHEKKVKPIYTYSRSESSIDDVQTLVHMQFWWANNWLKITDSCVKLAEHHNLFARDTANRTSCSETYVWHFTVMKTLTFFFLMSVIFQYGIAAMYPIRGTLTIYACHLSSSLSDSFCSPSMF